MLTTLYLIGGSFLYCIFFPYAGPSCTSVDPSTAYNLIVVAGLEFMFEIGGISVFKNKRKRDE